MVLSVAPPTHEVVLVTGEVLRGNVVTETPQKVVLDHETLGRIELAGDAVAEVRAIPPDAPALVPPPPPPVPQLAADEAFLPLAPLPPSKWKSRFELGLASASGVTSTTNLRLALRTAYDSEVQKYAILSSYSYARSEGVTTENKFNLTGLGDWPFRGSRWSVFGQAAFDYDEFQSWDERVTGGGGFRYNIVTLSDIDAKGTFNDTISLNARAGIGARKEFGSVDEDIVPEGIVGVDFSWRVSAKQQLVVGMTFFPDLDEFGEGRFTSRAEWVYNLADVLDGLNLIIGYSYEYQSQVDPGVSRNTLNIYASIGIGF
jgi:putative salt-induced outer membrane protein YdiY